MALQDLTPELRTRMSRVERLVGLFVFLAAILMALGFAYYLRETGKERGWFVNKVPYYCYTREATGLKPGDPVRLLGRVVGRIVEINTLPDDSWFLDNHYNIFVKFEVQEPYFGYIYTDSKVRILSADFFGARFLEITRGDPNIGLITVGPERSWETRTVRDFENTNEMVLLRTVLAKKKGVWLQNVEEAPAMADRVEEIVSGISHAVPTLTNQVSQLLTVASVTISNANVALAGMQPVVGDLRLLADRLSREEGVVGRMLLTSNLQSQVGDTLGSMESTLTNTTALVRTSEVQLQELTRRMAMTLDNVSMVTSNLSAQVQANSLILGEVSSLIVSADDMLHGLKKHWLLRSAFGPSSNAPIESMLAPSLDPSPR